MSDILDFYQEQAKARLSTTSWLAEKQVKALADFKRFKFPTRFDEDWKYTLLDSFLQKRFLISDSSVVNNATRQEDIPFSQQIVIRNGQVTASHQFLTELPETIIIEPLSKAIETHRDKIEPYLNKLLEHEHGFHALNTAALQTGLFIYLPENAVLEEPLVLAHSQDNAEQAVYLRHLIIAEQGSKASIIESYYGAKDCSYFTNTVTEIQVGAKAHIAHYKIQCESKAAFHISQLTVNQASQSHFESHVVSLGGGLARNDGMFHLQEREADCLMNGIYIPRGKQHLDHHTTVQHLVADCRSNEDYKGILLEASRAVFNGKVIVAKDAQHTCARQQNKNLLLSNKAEVDTKPQLEIFADDVSCSHGATVGQLDEEALFYLAARGLEKSEAVRYLIHAFSAENLRLISHAAIREWVLSLINQQLEQP